MRIASRRSSVHRWLAATSLPLVAATASADPQPCLSATGYALVGGHSNASLFGGDPVWLFDPSGNDVFCDPPRTDAVEISSPNGVAIVEYLAGTGLGIATGAIANPTSNGASSGHIAVLLILEFMVVPDDPGATGDVPILIRTRHDFGRVAMSVSGVGNASNSFEGFYEVRSVGPLGGPLLASWNTSGIVITDDETFDLANPVGALPNTPLYFVANLSQQSYAHDGFSPPGSGAADASSAITFQFETEAAATIAFKSESALGIPPPMLDVVAVPEAVGALAPIALAALAALRRLRGQPQPAFAITPGRASV